MERKEHTQTHTYQPIHSCVQFFHGNGCTQCDSSRHWMLWLLRKCFVSALAAQQRREEEEEKKKQQKKCDKKEFYSIWLIFFFLRRHKENKNSDTFPYFSSQLISFCSHSFLFLPLFLLSFHNFFFFFSSCFCSPIWRFSFVIKLLVVYIRSFLLAKRCFFSPYFFFLCVCVCAETREGENPFISVAVAISLVLVNDEKEWIEGRRKKS